MKKSTAAISLVVIGSVLTAGIIASSSSSEEKTDEKNGTNTAHTTGGGHHGGGWAFFGLYRMFGGGFGSGFAGRGPSVSTGASARGGFGSFGGMSAAS